MKTKLTTLCFLLGAVFAPMAAQADDNDKDRAHPGAFVKDSMITTKIKAKLAEEKMSSLVHVKVDTDNKGVVHLGGTAKSQEQIDRAGAIAASVEGVASVDNRIHLAGATGTMERHDRAEHRAAAQHVSYADKQDRVEDRIADMHAKLKITPEQEGQWGKIADIMRDNSRQMDLLTKTRAEHAHMNAVEDLRSYEDITEAHVDGIKKFTPAFASLYESMSDAQKHDADAMFSHVGHKKS